jgi:ABC-type sugar transport system, permease component
MSPSGSAAAPRAKARAGSVLACAGLTVLAALMIMPFVWMLSASFKFEKEIFEFPIRWIPRPFRVSNYVDVWTKIDFLRYYGNTVKLAVIITAGQIVTCSLAAYSFSRLSYRGRDKIFFAYIATLMIPWQAIMIPQFMIIKGLGLYQTHWSIILLQVFSPFGVFLLRQFMLGIPMELSQAAKIDGCSEFQIYGRIIMPLAKPALATLVIFTFNFVWNDYLGPLIYLDDDKLRTIQVGLTAFRTTYGASYGPILAGTVCALLPVVIIYIAAQKYVIEGIAFSGLKG